MATKEELEEQLRIARKDIEALAGMASDTARDQVANGADLAKAQLEHLSDETRALYDNARSQGAQLRSATEDHIRANPLATVGMSFAAGFVLAGLLGRK
ncbi:hypothetical protein Q4577_15855 [Marinovum sp. 2_MG-2023]|uniref:DUF883 family protein n=1 Tax=Roseobacteraceae TaxID=2854170 RepID=UPI001FD01317|nr:MULTISPECIES: hypothetical protein [Roseobacteraceae]MCJ7871365.1 hypothetical protein [Phaeobacter sp. J2-8]MDO6731509.1 hypothetical protein [Marinovum sp. 2_MG-2023]MDO6780869.1 hypothetical protein [Marinovum sp. 1_MG-2023]